MAKREKTAIEIKGAEAFSQMPIDEWLEYINENAKDDDEKRAYKVVARRSLTVANMKAYILKHDNTKKSKAEFKAATYAIRYEKDENKEYKKDADGKQIPILDDKGEPVKYRSLPAAASYFITQYMPELKVEPKAKAFDDLEDW